MGKKFAKTNTLKNREIYDNSDVVEMTAKERLKLDNGTSQWESAAVLCGSKERVSNAPHKLVQTYEVFDEFNEKGLFLEARVADLMRGGLLRFGCLQGTIV